MDAVLGAWVAAGLTLFMYSFLYKDNPFFKLGEHLFVGVSIGYTIVQVFYKTILKDLWNPMIAEGKWWLATPALLGLFIIARFIPKVAWLSRIAFAFIVGFGSGVAIPRIISSNILQQVQGTLKPLAGGSALFTWSHLNNLLILLGVVAVLFYFFFSIEHKGPVYGAARIGIYFLMVSFGASFGYTVMARMSLLIGRFDDLILFSSKEFGYASLVLLVAMILSLALWDRMRRPPTRLSSSQAPEEGSGP